MKANCWMGCKKEFEVTEQHQNNNMCPECFNELATMTTGPKDPTTITYVKITSNDLKDPSKLACVKAMVCSVCLVDEPDAVGNLMLSGSSNRLMLEWSNYGSSENYHHEIFDEVAEVLIKLDDIKLEPRLLIGEQVEVVADYHKQINTGFIIQGSSNIYRIRNLDVSTDDKLVRPKYIKITERWLDEKFEIVEI